MGAQPLHNGRGYIHVRDEGREQSCATLVGFDVDIVFEGFGGVGYDVEDVFSV